MDIIIPYRPSHNGLELKYALRSIEKYLKMDYGDIYLIGERFPNWITNVKTIECGEGTEKSSHNILKKIWEGLKVCGTAIQWQDDIFLTREVDSIPYYYDGTLSDWIEKTNGRYKQMIINTALQITENSYYFDIHTPIIYKKDWFSELFKYGWAQKNYILKSLYFHNTPLRVEHKTKCGTYCGYSNIEEISDCKLSEPMKKDEIKKKINGALYFSTGPQSINPDMIEVLEGLYPEPSKYERSI